MRTGGPAAALAVIGSILLAATPAFAHGPPAGGLELVDAPAAAEVADELGERAELRDDGLYKVTLSDGGSLLTHGGDPGDAFGAPAGDNSAVAARAGDLRSGWRRKPVCARDRQTRFAVALPPRRSAGRALIRTIRSSVARANALLSASSIVSGGPEADLKVACGREGRVEVGELETREHDLAGVVGAARAAGLRSGRANYLIFVRGRIGDTCGISSFRPDDRPGIENSNRGGGAYAVVYGNCRGSAEIVLHEIAHTMGAVQYEAPYSTGSGRHCWDELDVLCYSPDGGDVHQAGTLGRCPTVSFDCGNDTYFDAAPEPGEYLSTHWNLGSPLNHFIRFG